MRDRGSNVAGGVVAALIIALLTGLGVFAWVQHLGENLSGHKESQADSVPTSTLVASEPVPVPSNVVRVDLDVAADLVKAYLVAGGSRQYDAAWSTFSRARQAAVGRKSFNKFWNRIALTGFFPDSSPNAQEVVWRGDGAVSFTVRVFYDQCDVKTRSVEDARFVVVRVGDALRIDQYSASQVSELSHDPVSQEVLATCPPSQ